MRRCKAEIWDNGKKIPVDGLFHRWAQQFEDCGDAGIGNFTVALVELDDGRIVEAAPDTVMFLDVDRGAQSSDELKDAAAPLLEFLHKYYDPHAYAVVTESRVEVVRSENGAPLPVLD